MTETKMTVGMLKEILNNSQIDDNYVIEINVRRKLSEKEMEEQGICWPWSEEATTNFQLVDVSGGDRTINFEVNINNPV